MVSLQDIVAENIRMRREAMGMTKKGLAEKVGISEQSLANWESRRFLPTVQSLCDLADVFGCTVDELLGR